MARTSEAPDGPDGRGRVECLCNGLARAYREFAGFIRCVPTGQRGPRAWAQVSDSVGSRSNRAKRLSAAFTSIAAPRLPVPASFHTSLESLHPISGTVVSNEVWEIWDR